MAPLKKGTLRLLYLLCKVSRLQNRKMNKDKLSICQILLQYITIVKCNYSIHSNENIFLYQQCQHYYVTLSKRKKNIIH